MASLEFPAAPNDGDIYGNYQWDDTAGVWKLLPAATPTVEVGFRQTFLLMGS